MKQYVAALACAAAVCASAQTGPIPAPADWRAESFIFPLQFAPSIPYQGVEYVRFAPSWARFDSEGGFSYVFLWDVKTQPVTPEDLEDHLEAYFTGLMRNVGLQRKLSDKEIKRSAAGSRAMASRCAPGTRFQKARRFSSSAKWRNAPAGNACRSSSLSPYRP